MTHKWIKRVWFLLLFQMCGWIFFLRKKILKKEIFEDEKVHELCLEISKWCKKNFFSNQTSPKVAQINPNNCNTSYKTSHKHFFCNPIFLRIRNSWQNLRVVSPRHVTCAKISLSCRVKSTYVTVDGWIDNNFFCKFTLLNDAKSINDKHPFTTSITSPEPNMQIN